MGDESYQFPYWELWGFHNDGAYKLILANSSRHICNLLGRLLLQNSHPNNMFVLHGVYSVHHGITVSKRCMLSCAPHRLVNVDFPRSCCQWSRNFLLTMHPGQRSRKSLAPGVLSGRKIWNLVLLNANFRTMYDEVCKCNILSLLFKVTEGFSQVIYCIMSY